MGGQHRAQHSLLLVIQLPREQHLKPANQAKTIVQGRGRNPAAAIQRAWFVPRRFPHPALGVGPSPNGITGGAHSPDAEVALLPRVLGHGHALPRHHLLLQ